jgi:hypothetical protein
MTKLRHENPPRAKRTTREPTQPYKHVTDEDRARRRKEVAKAARERGDAILQAERDARFAALGIVPRKWFQQTK